MQIFKAKMALMAKMVPGLDKLHMMVEHKIILKSEK